MYCAHSGWTRARLDQCKPRLGQGTAVPMVDNGLERRWEMAQARTRQVEQRLGMATDGSAGSNTRAASQAEPGYGTAMETVAQGLADAGLAGAAVLEQGAATGCTRDLGSGTTHG